MSIGGIYNGREFFLTKKIIRMGRKKWMCTILEASRLTLKQKVVNVYNSLTLVLLCENFHMIYSKLNQLQVRFLHLLCDKLEHQ